MRAITDTDATAVRALVAACNRHERLDLAVNLDRAPTGEPVNQLLCHEAQMLVGIATFEAHQEIEVCIAVHPNYRRRGIGRRLLEAVKADTRERGRSSCLLVCEEASESGRGFVTAAGARYRSAEHRMRLDTDSAGAQGPHGAPLRLERVQAVHTEAVGRILAASFRSDPAHEEQRVAGDVRRPTHRYFLATLGGEPIGTFGVVTGETHIYVIGFSILPAHRGRGHGRTMLRDAIELLRLEGWKEISLEVATDNEPALMLYRSAGFALSSTYGYYELTV